MQLFSFALKTIPAEFKSSWQRSLLIVLCLAVGIASVSAVKIYTDSAMNYFTSNVKDYYGADLTISMPEKLTEEQSQFLENEDLGIVTIVENHNQIAFNPFNKQKNMAVQVTVIDPEVYPLYGSLNVVDDSDVKVLLQEKQAAIISASLLEQLELRQDGLVIIGNTPYVIKGILEAKAAQDGIVARVYTATKPTLSGGSLSTTQAYLRLDPKHKLNDIKAQAEVIFGKDKVSTYEDVTSHVGTTSKVLGNVALIAALASLLLGGLGVANASQVIARQKLKHSAIMKCLGGNTRQIVTIIIIQIATIGLVGILTGFLLGWALTGVFPVLLKDIISISIPIKPDLKVFLQISLLGLLVTIFFALLPVVKFARIRPLAVYRDDNPEKLLPKHSKLLTTGVVLILTVLLGLFVGIIIDFLAVGVGFALTTLFLTAIMLLIIRLLLKLVLKLPIYVSVTARMARRSLDRQITRAAGAILALALGIGSILLISFLEKDVLVFMGNILQSEKTPNIIALLDNKEGATSEQVTAFLEEDARVENVSTLKMLTGSIVSANDKPFTGEKLKNPNMVMMAKNLLIGSVDPERIPVELNYTEGNALTADHEMIMEEHIATSLGFKIGDQLGINIGEELLEFELVGFYSNAKVGVNFTALAYATSTAMGDVDSPFKTELLLARTKTGIAGKDVIQSLRAGVPDLRFAFDIGQIFDLFNTIFVAITRFMQFLGLFALIAGLVILAGTMILNKWEKRKETALIRCLGGTTKDVIKVQLWENGILGVLSAVIGIWLANLLSWTLDSSVLKLAFNHRPLTNISAFSIVLLAVIAVGTISLWDVLTERPLTVLRNE